MDERIVQFRIGVLVLGTVLVTAILLAYFNELPVFGRRSMTIYVAFKATPGVAIGTPVRKSGILIGRVVDTELTRNADVLVTLDIDARYPMMKNETCQIRGSLLGDAILEFAPGDPNHPEAGQLLEDGDRISGVVMSGPIDVLANLEGNLSQAIGAVTGTADEISRLARRVSFLLENNEDQIVRIAGKAEQTLDRVSSAADGIGQLVGDPVMRENLNRAITDLPEVLTEARAAMGQLQQTMSLADDNLRNLEGFTKPLGERGPQMVQNIEQMTGRLDEALSELGDFAHALNHSNGTVSRLIREPELYDHLSSAIENIDELTRELRPVVRDARVFTDRISRHPELLGVRGALKPSSGIK